MGPEIPVSSQVRDTEQIEKKTTLKKYRRQNMFFSGRHSIVKISYVIKSKSFNDDATPEHEILFCLVFWYKLSPKVAWEEAGGA